MNLRPHFLRVRKHRVFQILISTGVVSSVALERVFPAASSIVMVAVTLIWIWEQ
jgi:hypothetical protein